MGKIRILLFYKYFDMENVEGFRKKLIEICKESKVRGRILVAEEGVNGSVSGNKEETEKFKELLREDERFRDIFFKEDLSVSHPFNKLKVLIKKELVSLGEKINWKENKGKKISPKEFLELYEKGEDMIVLDARNDYEYRVGKFKEAIELGTKTFRDFPKALDKIEDKKDKKVVMYCTGGIRCEKASALLLKRGFKDVSQLDGGILTFGKELPDTVWEGKCFVFDKRLLSKINSEDDLAGDCEICEKGCDLYRNCKNNSCDKFCIVCLSCEKEFGGCCSKNCFIEMMKNRNLRGNMNFRDGIKIQKI
jgi:UPF0176 protein